MPDCVSKLVHNVLSNHDETKAEFYKICKSSLFKSACTYIKDEHAPVQARGELLNIIHDALDQESSSQVLSEYGISFVPLDIEVHSRLGTAEKKPNPYSSYGIFKAGN